MQVRDLKWRELPMWPPEWFLSCPRDDNAGVLEDVQLRADIAPILIIIEANFAGESKKGVVVLEDPTMISPIFDTLKDNIGKTLTQIGNLEIDILSLSPLNEEKHELHNQDHN